MKKRTKAELGKYSRSKGARREREVANAFKEMYGETTITHHKNGEITAIIKTRRIPQWQKNQTDPDVITPFMRIEVKNRKSVNYYKAWEQVAVTTERSGDKTRWPVAVCFQEKREPVVVMSWKDFQDMERERYERGMR